MKGRKIKEFKYESAITLKKKERVKGKSERDNYDSTFHSPLAVESVTVRYYS